MASASRVILTAGIVLAFASSTNAQTVPDDTAAFVSYCNVASFESCRRKVVDVNNIMLMRQLGGNHGCTIPHPAGKSRTDSVPATKAILDWLKNHETSRPAETDSAIAQAMEALWPENCEN